MGSIFTLEKIMAYLYLSILCSVLIANLLHYYNNEKGNRIFIVFLGNYCLATLISFSQNHFSLRHLPLIDTTIAVVAGIFFLLNFLVYQKNIRNNKITLSVSAMRISLVIPTFLSFILFNDPANLLNAIGILLAVVAFYLLTKKQKLSQIAWLIGLFTITGITDFLMKLEKELGSVNDAQYLTLLFFVAFVATLSLCMFKKQSFRWYDFSFGIVLGIPNQLTSLFFMKSLDSVSAVIAYPLFSIAVVILSLGTDIFIWKSKVSKDKWLIYALLLFGILLLNIR